MWNPRDVEVWHCRETNFSGAIDLVVMLVTAVVMVPVLLVLCIVIHLCLLPGSLVVKLLEGE